MIGSRIELYSFLLLVLFIALCWEDKGRYANCMILCIWSSRIGKTCQVIEIRSPGTGWGGLATMGHRELSRLLKMFCILTGRYICQSSSNCLLNYMCFIISTLYLNQFYFVFFNAFEIFHKYHIILSIKLPDNCLSIQGHTWNLIVFHLLCLSLISEFIRVFTRLPNVSLEITPFSSYPTSSLSARSRIHFEALLPNTCRLLFGVSVEGVLPFINIFISVLPKSRTYT